MTTLKELRESRGHSIIAKKLKTMEFLKTGGITKKEEPAVEKAHKELDTELHKQYGKRPEEMKEGAIGDFAKSVGKKVVAGIAGTALTAGIAAGAMHKSPESTISHLKTVAANTQAAAQTPSAQKKLADMRAKFAERQKQNKG